MGNTARRWLFHLQIWAGLALGLAALYLAARSFDLEALGQAMRGVRLPLVGLTLVTSLMTPMLKAARWRWLFHPQRPPLNGLQLASLVVIGQAINFLIPGRWGELVRAYLAGEECRISKWFTLGTLAAEKLLDLVILAVLVVALIPFVVLPEALAGQVEVVVLTALAVAVAAIALLGGRAFWLKLAELALRILPPAAAARWYQRIKAGLDGLAALGSRRAALAVWGWSAVFWLIAATTNLLLLLAFDLPPSPLIALVLLALLQGGVAVPSTPGKIGVFQLLCVLGLSAFGVPEATGLAYGLVLHVLVVGGVTTWAALALWARSLNLGRLARAARGWGE
ncbi:MAG: lysylphosphatidylglycerol synthase transmembrane domain-containing protein [Anaerolineae bacterium]